MIHSFAEKCQISPSKILSLAICIFKYMWYVWAPIIEPIVHINVLPFPPIEIHSQPNRNAHRLSLEIYRRTYIVHDFTQQSITADNDTVDVCACACGVCMWHRPRHKWRRTIWCIWEKMTGSPKKFSTKITHKIYSRWKLGLGETSQWSKCGDGEENEEREHERKRMERKTKVLISICVNIDDGTQRRRQRFEKWWKIIYCIDVLTDGSSRATMWRLSFGCCIVKHSMFVWITNVERQKKETTLGTNMKKKRKLNEWRLWARLVSTMDIGHEYNINCLLIFRALGVEQLVPVAVTLTVDGNAHNEFSFFDSLQYLAMASWHHIDGAVQSVELTRNLTLQSERARNWRQLEKLIK